MLMFGFWSQYSTGDIKHATIQFQKENVVHITHPFLHNVASSMQQV